MEPLYRNPLLDFGICFFLALIGFHLLLVWPRNLSKRQWKYIDYIWLSVGLLSLISLGGEIRRSQAEVVEEPALTHTSYMHELFVQMYITDASAHFCKQFERSPVSPNDLDEMQGEYDRLCSWWRQFAIEFSDLTLPNYSAVEWTQFNPPTSKRVFPREVLRNTKLQMSYYNRAANELRLVREAKQSNEIETAFFILWPFLFSIAVALRIAKTTGELRRERQG